MKKVILFCAVLFFVGGCMSTGREFNVSYVDDIQKGVTTETEIVSNIGKPVSVMRTSEGDRILTYMHIKTTVKGSTFIPIVGAFVGGANSDMQTLQIWIDKSGVVSRYLFNDNQTEINNG